MSDGLPHYLEYKARVLGETLASAQGDPEALDPNRWRVKLTADTVADDASGLRKLALRDFRLLVDAGPKSGGYDVAPSAPELLLGSLSSCLAHTVLMLAAQRDIELRSVTAEVSAQLWTGHLGGIESDDPIGPRDFVAKIAVDAPAASAEELEMLETLVDETCLVLAALRRANEVTVELERSAAG